MRIALVFLVLLGGVWLSGAPAAAAPVPLSGAAARAASDSAGTMVTTAGKRARTQKAVRRGTRDCGWQCRRYWRPFQYRYWKYYYPYGGPLF